MHDDEAATVGVGDAVAAVPDEGVGQGGAAPDGDVRRRETVARRQPAGEQDAVGGDASREQLRRAARVAAPLQPRRKAAAGVRGTERVRTDEGDGEPAAPGPSRRRAGVKVRTTSAAPTTPRARR